MRTASHSRSIWLCCAALLLTQCKKEPEPQSTTTLLPTASVAPAAAPPTAPAPAPVAITWEDPPAWKKVPVSNPMRKATYKVPRAAGDAEDAELAVFYFGPGEGGGIEANIDRWTKQFSGVKSDASRRSERSANGLKQHTIEVDRGTFSSGMPGGPTQPKEGFALLGGIVQAPSGAYFFKLTGPAATVKAAREAFYKLLDSVKPT